MALSNPTLAATFADLGTEDDLKTLTVAKTKEDLHIEFKTKRDRSTPHLEDSEKRNFSKSLSGFANSDGGILVWGIETDQHDCALKLKPISEVRDFLDALKKSILNSTLPVVDDVALDFILPSSPSAGTAGYVKCLIPASEKTPHRAMLADREYYKRTIEGFYRLEHFDLEDMFGRRPVPRLQITAQLRSGPSGYGHTGNTQAVAVDLTLENVGRGSARAPYVHVIPSYLYYAVSTGVSITSHQLLRLVTDASGDIRLVGLSDFLIHPGTGFHFASVTRNFKTKSIEEGDLRIRALFAAENARLQETEFHYSLDQLLDFVRWNRSGPLPPKTP